METPQIWEEIFKAGFKAGCGNGRVELTRADIETNAEAAWRHWCKEKEKETLRELFKGLVEPTKK